MTKEQRNLLQGVKIGSVIEYSDTFGHYRVGKVVGINFFKTNPTVILEIIDNRFNKSCIELYQIFDIVISNKLIKEFGF